MTDKKEMIEKYILRIDELEAENKLLKEKIEGWKVKYWKEHKDHMDTLPNSDGGYW